MQEWPFVHVEEGTNVLTITGEHYVGSVISRPNRFLVHVLYNGKPLICHLHDPGRLRELIFPGNPVLFRKSKGVKTEYSITAAYLNDRWILTDTRFHNTIASKFIDSVCRGEIKYGKHRLDFRCGNLYVEVKGGTLLEDGYATFPDAPTLRGSEHLKILLELKSTLKNSALIILFFNSRGTLFRPNRKTDPEFSRLFYRCLEEGVAIRIFKFDLKSGPNVSNIVYAGEIDISQPD